MESVTTIHTFKGISGEECARFEVIASERLGHGATYIISPALDPGDDGYNPDPSTPADELNLPLGSGFRVFLCVLQDVFYESWLVCTCSALDSAQRALLEIHSQVNGCGPFEATGQEGREGAYTKPIDGIRPEVSDFDYNVVEKFTFAAIVHGPSIIGVLSIDPRA